MSREAVAWLTRSPAARSARTNCAWVWIGSAVMTSRILRSRGRTDLLPHPLLRRRRRRDPLPQEPHLPPPLLHLPLHPPAPPPPPPPRPTAAGARPPAPPAPSPPAPVREPCRPGHPWRPPHPPAWRRPGGWACVGAPGAGGGAGGGGLSGAPAAPAGGAGARRCSIAGASRPGSSE